MEDNKALNNNSEFTQWLSGIPYELAFWNNVFRWTSTFKGMMSWSKFGKNIQLDGMDIESLLKDSDNPTILDIGCGLSFANGDKFTTSDGKEKHLDIHYIDPLADYYNIIKRRHKRNLPDIEFGMMEHIASTWDGPQATLCIICNALDHSSSPLQGIMEVLKVLKVGGCLYLNHHPNEAEAEHYKGFHKFNICIDESQQLIIWNKSQRIIVSEKIADYASIQAQTLDNGFVVAVITKTAEIPNEREKEYDSDYLKSLILAPSKTQTFKIKYAWYNLIQFFVQALSWENKQKLKRLIEFK